MSDIPREMGPGPKGGDAEYDTDPDLTAPDDVRYLSLEGGGGKGAAYIGALAALSHDDVGILVPVANTDDEYALDTDRIAGIAGASAGAITATMLASGYTLSQLARLTTDRRLEQFFDPPGEKRSYAPVVRKGQVSPTTVNGQRLLGVDSYPRKRNSWFERQKIQFGVGALVDAAANWLVDDKRLSKLLASNDDSYAENLYYDYGLFSGCYARSYFSRRIVQNATAKLRDRNNKGQEVTFGEHYSHPPFGHVKLALVGTNVTTGEAAYLGTGRTDDFKVADAVRISMGIPFAFKPVAVERSQYPGLEGVWVDGGTLNNNPIHAFDRTPGDLVPGMLGLRLGVPGTNPTNSMGEYAAAVGNTVLDGSSNREIRTAQERAQVIDLPTGQLSTFKFLAPAGEVRAAAVDAASAVFEYFRAATGNDVGVDPAKGAKVEAFVKSRVPTLWKAAAATP